VGGACELMIERLRASDLGFRVNGVGCRVWDFGRRVSGDDQAYACTIGGYRVYGVGLCCRV